MNSELGVVPLDVARAIRLSGEVFFVLVADMPVWHDYQFAAGRQTCAGRASDVA
jgi:hypothetical protein